MSNAEEIWKKWDEINIYADPPPFFHTICIFLFLAGDENYFEFITSTGSITHNQLDGLIHNSLHSYLWII